MPPKHGRVRLEREHLATLQRAHDLGRSLRKAHVRQVRRRVARERSRLVGHACGACAERQRGRGLDIARALAERRVVDEDVFALRAHSPLQARRDSA